MHVNPLGNNFNLNASSSNRSLASRAFHRLFKILCTPIALVMALLSFKRESFGVKPLSPARIDTRAEEDRALLGDQPETRMSKTERKEYKQATRRFLPNITTEERKIFQ